MDKIIRQFGEVRASKDEDRTVEFTFSTNAKDRHHTVLNQSGWDLDNFNRNGIAGYMHDVYGGFFGGSDPDDVIGKAKAWVDGDKLKGSITFEPADLNPKADKIFRKINFGSLNAVSVGFIEKGKGHDGDPEKGEDPGSYYFDRQELLEISVVNVPSNPEALKSRGFSPYNMTITDMDGYSPSDTTAGTEHTYENLQTDLTEQVTKSTNMEKEEKKDLAPETSKVEHEVKLDAEALAKAIADGVKEGFKAQPKPEDIPGPVPSDLSAEDQKTLNRYSIRRAILKEVEQKQGRGRLDGVELEMHQEAVKEGREVGKEIAGLGIPTKALYHQRADLKATVDAQGGYTVATDTTGFIDTLKNNMATIKAGAQLLTGLVGDVSIPKLSANSTATWRTEGGVATQSDPTFTAVTMTPHRLTTYTEFTQQLLRQSSLDIEAIVRNNLYYSVANALETAALEGDGNSQVPQGILNAGVNDATHGSTAPTLASWTNIINMEKMVAVDNALVANMAFILKATAAAQLKITTRDSTAGGYIWENDPLLGGMIDGYPAYVTNVFTNDSVIYGNWSELYIGQWGGIDLLVNPYSLDTYATIRVIIAGYYDLAVRHAESFARIDDLKLT